MMLINNRNYLQKNNKLLLDELVKVQREHFADDVILEESKIGKPTLKIKLDSAKSLYLHSKYNPLKEAASIIDNHTGLKDVDYVVFFGAGLGYHIEYFQELYPGKKFVIYEPNLAVLYRLLENKDINMCNDLWKILSSFNSQSAQSELREIMGIFGGNLAFVCLPAYKNLYREEVDSILLKIKQSLTNKKTELVTNAFFQQRWTINAIKNFPKILSTPNILHDIDKEQFEGKTAIIVSAGPSLSDEFENLRHIKENGLAYIFSVGSAINALIAQGIHPDATCSYDPQEHNYKVIQTLKDKNIPHIPLIFGSTVGYETLHNYAGPMLHMLINQDTVAPNLLKSSNIGELEMIHDASSIAIVTFELLAKLGFSTIILVGQNLAYENNQLYAQGIHYEHLKTTLTDEETKNMMLVENVHGQLVRTSNGFNLMRKQLEIYIAAHKNIKVINTTKRGAKIEGTRFLELEYVIKHYLNTSYQDIDLSGTENSYDKEYSNRQINNLERSQEEVSRSLKKIKRILKDIKQSIEKKLSYNMELKFATLDKEFHKLKQHLYYRVLIEPMVRIQNKRLSEKTQLIRYESNTLRKGSVVTESFTNFLMEVEKVINLISPYFDEVQETLAKCTRE